MKQEHHATECTHAGPLKEPWKCVPVPCPSLHLSILRVLPEARASIAGASQKKLLLNWDWL